MHWGQGCPEEVWVCFQETDSAAKCPLEFGIRPPWNFWTYQIPGLHSEFGGQLKHFGNNPFARLHLSTLAWSGYLVILYKSILHSWASTWRNSAEKFPQADVPNVESYPTFPRCHFWKQILGCSLGSSLTVLGHRPKFAIPRSLDPSTEVMYVISIDI